MIEEIKESIKKQIMQAGKDWNGLDHPCVTFTPRTARVLLDYLNNSEKSSDISPIIESRQYESFIGAKERARQFNADLKALLIKHGAYLELEENESTRFAHQKGDDDIVVTMDTIWQDTNCLAEYSEVNLGRYVDSDSL